MTKDEFDKILKENNSLKIKFIFPYSIIKSSCEIVNTKLGTVIDTIQSNIVTHDILMDGREFLAFSTDAVYTITNSCKYKDKYIIGFEDYLIYADKNTLSAEFIEIV